MTSRSPEEPPERSARPSRRAGISCDLLLGPDEVSRLVASWLADACVLEARPLSEASLLRLRDFRRISEELRRVVLGDEDGEGTQEARTFHAAASAGRIQAVAALFACPRATFVEYLLAAPWNLLGPEDPPDLRVVRGAGQALLAKASAWSFARDAGGRVALQAENPAASRSTRASGSPRSGSPTIPSRSSRAAVAGGRRRSAASPRDARPRRTSGAPGSCWSRGAPRGPLADGGDHLR
ncbi:MAG: N-acetyltransferase [Anaeromyxobacteraceae bacterium]